MKILRFEWAAVIGLLAATLANGALACGGAVTDPLDEGFISDPAPIIGIWHLQAENGELDPAHDLEIIRGAGVLFGRFEFPLFSQEWQIQFADVGNWNGMTFSFTHPETFGLNLESGLEWVVRYHPADDVGPVFSPAFLQAEGIRTFRYYRPGTEFESCEEPCILGSIRPSEKPRKR